MIFVIAAQTKIEGKQMQETVKSHLHNAKNSASTMLNYSSTSERQSHQLTGVQLRKGFQEASWSPYSLLLITFSQLTSEN